MERYLPKQEVGMVPVSQAHEGEGKTFANEREILYQVLFDMKKDLNDLKQVVRDMLNKDPNKQSTGEKESVSEESLYRLPVKYSEKFLKSPYGSIMQDDDTSKDDVQDATEYVEESLAIHEVERDMIIKALERHGGTRKLAANDLQISERTLYRKIKEYQLEDL